MSIKLAGVIRKIIISIVFISSLSPLSWAGQLDRDPILETQTKTVAVTEESLKEDSKKGAPSPSFQLIKDSSEFYVQDPVEHASSDLDRLEKKRKRGWWFFSHETDKKTDEDNSVSDSEQ